MAPPPDVRAIARARGDRVVRFRLRRLVSIGPGEPCQHGHFPPTICPPFMCIENDGEVPQEQWRLIEPQRGDFFVKLEVIDP